MPVKTRRRMRKRRTEHAEELAQRYLQSMSARAGCPEQLRLVELWRNWHLVMGEEISSLCVPAGHKQRRLEVAAEDSMAMQELMYLGHEMVHRANAFMEEAFFEDVKVTLAAGRKGLAATSRQEEDPVPSQRFVPARATGKLLDTMDPDSPVARCYKAWSSRSPD